MTIKTTAHRATKTPRTPKAEAPVTYARRPFYPTGTIHGPAFGVTAKAWSRPKLPAPVGYLGSTGHREALEWKWNGPCPRCAAKTEFGYCTRCDWTCSADQRPVAEPLSTHTFSSVIVDGISKVVNA